MATKDGQRDVKDAGPLSPLLEALSRAAPPLIYLFGKERYLINRGIDLIKAAVLDPRTKDFNLDVYEGKEATPAKILSAARTLPMMAQRRMVMVRDADELTAEELAGLSDYLARPAPETCLLFVAEKADQRLRFFTAFKKSGLLLKLDPLGERQLPAFVKGEAKRLGAKLEFGAAERIAEEIGSDLGQIVDALSRLSIYVAQGEPIRVSDVEEVVATTRQHTVFELIDAVGGGGREAALTLLSGILAAREPALRLLAMLARHVRQLWVTRDVLTGSKRAGQGEVAQALGVPPFVAMKLMDQARRLSGARIVGMHEAIYQTDRALKLSKLDDQRHMEALILRLCG